MATTFYIKQVRKHGMEMWRAWAERDGEVVWSATRWSEQQAKSEALRQAALLK